MIIREATGKDVFDLKKLYFEFLTKWPPKEEQNMEQWAQILEDFRKNDSFYILVVEDDGKVVSSVQLAIIPSLTHNVRSFAIVENVVTHESYRNKG